MLTRIAEQRKSERIPVRIPVKVILPAAPPLDCIAIDVSDGGVRLQLRGAQLPDVFVLHFVESGKQRHCRVVWRQGSEFGVAFTDTTQAQFGRRVAARSRA